MCSVELAFTIGGTLLSAVGQFQQVQAANQQAAFQAQVARNNAVIQQQLATDAIRRGKEAADAQRRRNAVAKGQQRSAVAAAGVVVDQGSSLDLLLDAAELGEMDVLNTLENSRREAFQFQVGATNDLAQASLFDAQRSSPLLAAGGTLLSGLGKTAATFNQPATLSTQVEPFTIGFTTFGKKIF